MPKTSSKPKTTKKQDEKYTLTVEKRSITGKKVRTLRSQGIIPANIFGSDFTSVSVQLPVKDFTTIYKSARETGVVHVHVDKDIYPTLIRNVQKHPVSHEILHVDFRKIDLAKKIEAQVPVAVIGESPAVNNLGGVLLTQTDELTIEALPADIPDKIEVDISTLTELGTEIAVSDLKKSAGYKILDEPEKIIVSVIEHKEESITPETTSEAPEVLTEKEGAEGEAEATAEEGGKTEETEDQAGS